MELIKKSGRYSRSGEKKDGGGGRKEGQRRTWRKEEKEGQEQKMGR